MKKTTVLLGVGALLLLGVALVYGGAALLVSHNEQAEEAVAVTESVVPSDDETLIDSPAPATIEPEAPQNRVAVATQLAEYKSVVRDVRAVGSLQARDSVLLRSEITGRIAVINFTEGDNVEQGQVLIQLDASTAEAQLQEAKARLSLAQSQFQRNAQLSAEGFISSQAKDESASQLAVARANVALAQAQLAKTSIRAPFTGLVGLKNVSVGDYVSPGSELVSVDAVDPLEVDFRVPEYFLADVQVGSPLFVRLDAFPDIQYQGFVGAIHPRVDTAGRSIWLRAQVPNEQLRLRPGLFARINLTLDEHDAVMVPESAIAPSGSAQYVFKVVNDTVQRIEVNLGQRSDAWVEVLGIDAGDEIVVSGTQKVAEGTVIRRVD